MLKVYGTKLCPDCIAMEANFKKAGIDYEFVNIFESMPKFKSFLDLRDKEAVFDHSKEIGDTGLPALQREDGSLFLNWEDYLTDLGFEVFWPKEAEAQMQKIEAELAQK